MVAIELRAKTELAIKRMGGFVIGDDLETGTYGALLPRPIEQAADDQRPKSLPAEGSIGSHGIDHQQTVMNDPTGSGHDPSFAADGGEDAGRKNGVEQLFIDQMV